MYEREHDDGDGDWRENRRLVSANFRQLFNRADDIIRKLDEHDDEDRVRFEALTTELTTLKTKAAIWGAIGGFIAATVGSAIAAKLMQ